MKWWEIGSFGNWSHARERGAEQNGNNKASISLNSTSSVRMFVRCKSSINLRLSCVPSILCQAHLVAPRAVWVVKCPTVGGWLHVCSQWHTHTHALTNLTNVSEKQPPQQQHTAKTAHMLANRPAIISEPYVGDRDESQQQIGKAESVAKYSITRDLVNIYMF